VDFIESRVAEEVIRLFLELQSVLILVGIEDVRAEIAWR